MPTTLLFSHGYMDFDRDRDNYCCHGVLNTGESVGFCKYYSLDPTTDVVYIEYIHIHANQRRKGHATQFVEELQTKYCLEWDYSFTPEGRKWYNALIDQKVVDSHIISEQSLYV